jgi:hypothetical protein
LGKAINIEEKLDIISQLEKGKQIFDICHNVSFTHMRGSENVPGNVV